MTVVAVDGHVHVHEGWERDQVLDAAWANVSRAAGGASSVTGVLLLAEVAGRDVFASWAGQVGAAPGDWRLGRTREEAALVARREGGEGLVVVAGRQVRSREGLEVLAQGTTRPVADGGTFAEAVARALRAAPLVSVPWGFGKWWGGRGRAVARVVASSEGAGVLLSDSGLRPAWSPRPPLLTSALAAGRPVLAGSDPLPLGGQLERVGCYGVILAGPLDLERPVAWLERSLRAGPAPRPYGVRRSVTAFLSDQVRLRLSS